MYYGTWTLVGKPTITVVVPYDVYLARLEALGDWLNVWMVVPEAFPLN